MYRLFSGKHPLNSAAEQGYFIGFTLHLASRDNDLSLKEGVHMLHMNMVLFYINGLGTRFQLFGDSRINFYQVNYTSEPTILHVASILKEITNQISQSLQYFGSLTYVS